MDIITRMEPTIWRIALAVAGKPAGSETTIAMPHGILFVSPTNYRDVRTLSAAMYEPDVTRLFEKTLRTGMSVIDVGAYIGYYSVLASRLVGSSGRVYAFEPNPTALTYLERNIARNDCSNVVTVGKAVLDGSQPANLVSDPSGPESFITQGDATDMNSLPVPTVSLDEFAQSEGWPSIDLIKMDVEGSEVMALRGMRQLSQRNTNLQLIIEFNPAAMSRARLSRAALGDALRQLGFRHCYLIERDMELVEHDILPQHNAVSNLLLTKTI